MEFSARRVTVAAVCTAIAVLACVATVYLPFSFMPLYLAAFCIFLACRRAGAVYGALCAVSTAGLMFLMSGLSCSWLLLVIMFAPYGIAAHFAHPFTYYKLRRALVRAATAAAFFNLTLGAVYLIVTRVLTAGIDIPLADWAQKLGGYPLFALVGTLVLVPLDVIFSVVSETVLRRLPGERGKKPPVDAPGTDAGEFDIFGYEISPDKAEFEVATDGEPRQNPDEISENAVVQPPETPPNDGQNDE